MGKFMALIKCNECGKQVSSNAINCPNCGNLIQVQVKLQNEKEKGSTKVLAIIIVVGVILYILSKS
jgi:DNA-directed RNA polymerase subunit RPC12/RpoP